MSICKATPALGKLFFISLFTLRKVISTRRVTRCCTKRNSPLLVALGQRKTHLNSDRHKAVHQRKVDPGVAESPWDHLKKQKVVFTLYRTVKQNVAKCVSNRVPVYNGNASSRTIFAPEQDCSSALLKVERIVSDRFSK